MDRITLMKKLDKIESELPVYEWYYNDIPLWPQCKWIILMHTRQIPFANKVKNSAEPLKNKLSIRIKLLLKYLKGVLAFLSLYTLPKIDVIFLGGSAHRVDFNDKFINRYFEPLKDKYTSHLNVELDVDLSKTYPERFIINLKKFDYFFALRQKFLKNKSDIRLTKLEQLSNYFSPNELNINKLKESLFKYIKNVENHAYIFDKILKITKPTEVLSLCYYSNPNFGLHLAANRLNIPNSDIQHGMQGPLHPMYNFNNLPKHKIMTLPQEFWVWDESNLRQINSWIQENTYHHVSKKGNPWWSYAISNTKEKTLDSDKLIVLYTHQTGLLDHYILDAIGLSDEKIIWLIRLHPRFKYLKPKLIEQLNNRGLMNRVNIDDATSLPLPVLVKACFIHISKNSGSIVEVEAMGKPTIILERLGVTNFSDYINNGNSIGLIEPTGKEINAIILNYINV